MLKIVLLSFAMLVIVSGRRVIRDESDLDNAIDSNLGDDDEKSCNFYDYLPKDDDSAITVICASNGEDQRQFMGEWHMEWFNRCRNEGKTF